MLKKNSISSSFVNLNTIDEFKIFCLVREVGVVLIREVDVVLIREVDVVLIREVDVVLIREVGVVLIGPNLFYGPCTFIIQVGFSLS